MRSVPVRQLVADESERWPVALTERAGEAHILLTLLGGSPSVVLTAPAARLLVSELSRWLASVEPEGGDDGDH